MASNYPSDPNNAASLNRPSGPQSGPGGFPSDYSLPPVAPQPLSAPMSSPQASSSPISGGEVNGGHQRRLVSGTELSGKRYKIERPVAAGGMGAVYRAIDTRFNRPCAVKEMLDEFQNDTERTQAGGWVWGEGHLFLYLNHPCISPVRDFFFRGGQHYLVMDFFVEWT